VVPNAYQKAIKTYQKKTDESLTPMQIVVELYKGMLRFEREAKAAWIDGKLDVMTEKITKIFNIIEALQAHLDHEKGGEDAQFLNRFYTVVFKALTDATSKPDPAAEFDAIIAYTQQIHDRWYAIAYQRNPEDPN
jgi:flagellar protein FliS